MWPVAAIIAAGLILFGFAVAAAFAAVSVAAGTHVAVDSMAIATSLIVSGGAYLAACIAIRRPLHRWVWFWVVAIGMLCRVALLPVPTLHETDCNRYLWDGMVWVHGYNPWQYSPAAALNAKTSGLPPGLHQLAVKNRRLVDRINHNRLPTIYPPASEAVFAVAAWIAPASIVSLKLMLMIFDIGTAFLVWLTLRRLKLPRIWLLFYWWNPIVIDSFALQAHLDSITIFFVMLLFFLLVCGRRFPAAVALGLAVAAKFWPMVLLLVLLRADLKRPWRAARSLLISVAAAAVALAPMFTIGSSAYVSLSAYGRYWQINTLVFHLLFRLWRHFTATWDAAHLAATATVVIIYLGVAPLPLRRAATGRQLVCAGLYLIGFVFLLGPTAFPWYYTWLVPALAITPRPSWLVWSCTLGLYHVCFQYPEVVWFEHLPVIILLLLEAFVPSTRGFFDVAPGDLPIDRSAEITGAPGVSG